MIYSLYCNAYQLAIKAGRLTGYLDDAGKADRFISWIEEMKIKMDIPEYLDIIRDEDMDQIIRWAVKEANPLYPTPVLWRKEDFRKFIESVRV